MEDNPKGRKLQSKKTKMRRDSKEGRKPQSKTTSNEHSFKGRHPKRKTFLKKNKLEN